MANQFHDSADNTGIIQVFKRMESTKTEDVYYLSGLEADTLYRVEDIDTGAFVELTGRQLMCKGIRITLGAEFAAEIFRYAPVLPTD